MLVLKTTRRNDDNEEKVSHKQQSKSDMEPKRMQGKYEHQMLTAGRVRWRTYLILHHPKEAEVFPTSSNSQDKYEQRIANIIIHPQQPLLNTGKNGEEKCQQERRKNISELTLSCCIAQFLAILCAQNIFC